VCEELLQQLTKQNFNKKNNQKFAANNLYKQLKIIEDWRVGLINYSCLRKKKMID